MKWLETCSPGDRKRVEIISKALGEFPDMVIWLFKKDCPEMIDGSEKILYEAGVFSSGQQILIRFACDVWFGESKCNVFDLTRRLDGKNFVNVMEAMAMWRRL